MNVWPDLGSCVGEGDGGGSEMGGGDRAGGVSGEDGKHTASVGGETLEDSVTVGIRTSSSFSISSASGHQCGCGQCHCGCVQSAP